MLDLIPNDSLHECYILVQKDTMNLGHFYIKVPPPPPPPPPPYLWIFSYSHPCYRMVILCTVQIEFLIC